MNINLTGAIVIVDEAHNIEDSCRDAASFTVLQDHITNSIQQCEEVLETVKNGPKKEPCVAIVCWKILKSSKFYSQLYLYFFFVFCIDKYTLCGVQMDRQTPR